MYGYVMVYVWMCICMCTHTHTHTHYIGSVLSLRYGINWPWGSEVVVEVPGLPPTSSMTLDKPPSIPGPQSPLADVEGYETSGIL